MDFPSNHECTILVKYATTTARDASTFREAYHAHLQERFGDGAACNAQVRRDSINNVDLVTFTITCTEVALPALYHTLFIAPTNDVDGRFDEFFRHSLIVASANPSNDVLMMSLHNTVMALWVSRSQVDALHAVVEDLRGQMFMMQSDLTSYANKLKLEEVCNRLGYEDLNSVGSVSLH